MNILKVWKANLQIADIINVHFCEITVCNAFSANYSYKTNNLKKYHDFHLFGQKKRDQKPFPNVSM